MLPDAIALVAKPIIFATTQKQLYYICSTPIFSRNEAHICGIYRQHLLQKNFMYRLDRTNKTNSKTVSFLINSIALSTSLASLSLGSLFCLPLLAQPSAKRFQPLSVAACGQLRQQMAQTLRVRVMGTNGPFQDYLTDERGTGCLLTARGNGRNFTSVAQVARDINSMLVRQGWKEDTQYAADGPTARGKGFRKGNNLALFLVEWEPATNANCPPDEPISSCQLSPEQALYEITLKIASQTR